MVERKGLVTRVQGKGTFVYEEAKSESKHPQTAQTITDYMHRSQYLMYTQRRKGVDLSSSTVQTELLPLAPLLESVQHLMEKEPEILCQYGDIKGDGQLRKAAANYLFHQDVSVNSDEILITSGSQQGIDLVARCFLRPRDVVVTEETTYSAAIDTFRGTGATILPVPLDRDGLCVERLTALCDTVQPRLIYTIPTFHNPTGTVMSLKKRRQLLQLAESIPCLIVEDDPWSEIYFDNPPPPSIKSLDSAGNVIYLKGLSKILSPGCRIGLLAASGTVLKRLLIAKTNSDLGSPLLTQRVILPLLRSKGTQTYFQQLRQALKKRRDVVVRCLQEHAPPGIDWLTPSGGFNLWLTLPKGTNAHDILLHGKSTNDSHRAFHSATKYIGGHSDVVAGVCAARKGLAHQVRQKFSFHGPHLDPFAAWLLCRGIRTLGLRIRQQNENALELAQYLESHPKVNRVFYPMLESHPQHGLACRQMKGGGGMICFEIRGGMDASLRFISTIKLSKLAVSLGGVSSTITHPSSMTHNLLPREEREKAGITDGMLRFSVGIEEVNDLKEDLEEAFHKI